MQELLPANEKQPGITDDATKYCFKFISSGISAD